MSDIRAAAEALARARAVHGTPPTLPGISPSAPPAERAPRRAASPPASARPAAPGRARPDLVEEGRPLWMERMGIPLTGLSDSTLHRLDRLEELLGAYEGWGRDDDNREYGAFFLDVGGRRFHGRSLHKAISAAFAAARAA